jgi:cold shock CspA family protein
MTGRIVRLVAEKGYGFIRADDNREYFFHRSGLKNCQFDDLTIGKEVTFEDAESDKGLRAEDIYV